MADWDERYKSGFTDHHAEPHGLVARFYRAVPKGRVLDVAMGAGRDGLFLAQRGYEVYGLERSIEAIKLARRGSLEDGVRLFPIQGDAAALPFKKESMEGIIVFYFFLRESFGDLLRALKRGGTLIYETFLKRQNEIDRYRNPDFLLGDGELIEICGSLDLLHYEEGVRWHNGKQRAVAQFVGRKR
jgi:tellurite methyltransferase